MKIGDLVKWSDTNASWHLIHYDTVGLVALRQRGIILDKNPKFFFVLWENGEVRANMNSDLEVVSES